MPILERKTKWLIDARLGFSLNYVKDIFLAEHTHDYYEIFIVTSGEVYHVVNSEERLLKPGSVCALHPGDSHYYRNSNLKEFSLINFMVTPETLCTICSTVQEGAGLFAAFEKSISDISIGSALTQTYHKKFLDLLALSPCRYEQFSLESKLLLIQIVGSVLLGLQKASYEHPPFWFEEMLKKMELTENYIQGVSRMSEISGRSLEYISRLFKRYMRMTPTKWLKDIRLQNARILLTNTDLSVLDISLEVGFNTLSNFYKAFEEQFGMTPGVFRKRLISHQGIEP